MNDSEKLLTDSQFLRAMKDPVILELTNKIFEAYHDKDFKTENKLIKLLSSYNQLNYPELLNSLPLTHKLW